MDRYNLPQLPSSVKPLDEERPTSAFMTALLNESDAKTTNGAPAYSTSSNALVDLFWNLTPVADVEDLNPLLEAAWSKDPLGTLRIIWQARSIHEGKGIRQSVFYHLVAFLYQHHPRTLIGNLHLLVTKECTRPDLAVSVDEGVQELVERDGMSHGFYKDLLNILILAISGTLDKDVTPECTSAAFNLGVDSKIFAKHLANKRKTKLSAAEKKAMFAAHQQRRLGITRLLGSTPYPDMKKEDKHAFLRQRLKVKLEQDLKFRAMYVVICKLFAEAMTKDLVIIKDLETAASEDRYSISRKLTLAAKWAPTPARAHDKQLFVSSTITSIMFPEVEGTIERRMSYQNRVLTPLRKALDIPEVKMAAGQWDQINYSRCSSKCMARNKVHFFLHDETRFTQYLKDVAVGKKKISGATLLPHELVVEAYKAPDPTLDSRGVPPEMLQRLHIISGSVVDAQWNSLAESIREVSSNGKGLSNSIAVVDVSGSMGTVGASSNKNHPQPIDVALALGLLTAQLAEPPFNGAFITFSAEPAIVRLPEKKTLRQLIGLMSHAKWGMNTAFDKVFELLLDIAIQNKLKKEEMIRRIFVFSGMQFDAANQPQHRTAWTTTHQIYISKYNEAGYDLPEIVYWNIQGSDGPSGNLPARADQPGVQLLSGYSGSMMKTFLRGDAADVMEEMEDAEDAEDESDGDIKLEDNAWQKVSASTDPKKTGAKDETVTPMAKLAQILANPAFAKLRVLDYSIRLAGVGTILPMAVQGTRSFAKEVL